VTPVAGLETTEEGGAATFTVVLKSQPTAAVVIPIASSDPTEGAASPAAIAFTAANWSVPQTVTVDRHRRPAGGRCRGLQRGPR
jgi:hypothetical protein